MGRGGVLAYTALHRKLEKIIAEINKLREPKK